MRVLMVLLFLALGGCQTLAGKAANDCQSIGIDQSHPDYQPCVLSMMQQRQRALDSLSNRMGQMSRDMQPRYYVAPAPNFPVRCTRWANTVTCQ